MSLKDHVAGVLRDAGLERGYAIRETADGAMAMIEYPEDEAALRGWSQDSRAWGHSPGAEISRCDEILRLAGYDTELVPGSKHHVLVVRRPA